MEHGLPAAERDVLACLHRHGEATSRQVLESLAPFRPMSHGSVVTLLRRLEAKGFIAKRKGPVGKALLYRSRQRSHVTFGNAVRQLLQRVFHGDTTAAFASLLEAKPPSLEEVEKLQEMLDQLKERQQRRQSK